MKAVKPRYDLFLTAYLPIFLFGMLALTFIPQAVWLGLHLSWIWLVIAIFWLVKPNTATLPPIPPRRYKPLSYLARLWGLQLGSLVVFLGVLLMLVRGVASPNNHYPEANVVLLQALQFCSWHWGLYPWALYTVYALHLQTNKDKSSANLAGFIQISAQSNFSIVINFCLKQALLIGIVSTLGFFIWHFSHLAGFLSATPFTQGWRIKTLLISSILFLPLIQANTLKRFTSRLKPSFKLYHLCLFVFFLAIVLLLLANLAVNWIQAHYPPLPPHAKMPTWSWVSATDWRLYWWAWWLCWTPLVAKIITNISKGYNKLTIISSCLSLPALISLTLWLNKDTRWLMLLDKLCQSNILLPGLSLVLFFALLKYTPIDKFLAPVGVGQRPEDMRYSIIQSILTFTTIYMVAGCSIPTTLVWIFTAPCAVLLAACLFPLKFFSAGDKSHETGSIG